VLKRALSRLCDYRRRLWFLTSANGGTSTAMTTTTVDEIAPDIFRIATFNPERPLNFIQFLIRDEKPLLYHTGFKAILPDTLEAVRRIIDPAGLRYISWSHLEGDECGAINDFLTLAPDAEPVQGQIGRQAAGDFIARPVTVVPDDGVLDLGTKKLRFLMTPNVPHCWDAIMTYEETTGTLFCSDLFAIGGEQPALTDRDMVEQAVAQVKRGGDALPIGRHTGRVLERLAALQPRVLAGHHSSAYTGDAASALRDLRKELLDLADIPDQP
jgi:flavorubredoxin